MKTRPHFNRRHVILRVLTGFRGSEFAVTTVTKEWWIQRRFSSVQRRHSHPIIPERRPTWAPVSRYDSGIRLVGGWLRPLIDQLTFEALQLASRNSFFPLVAASRWLQRRIIDFRR